MNVFKSLAKRTDSVEHFTDIDATFYGSIPNMLEEKQAFIFRIRSTKKNECTAEDFSGAISEDELLAAIAAPRGELLTQSAEKSENYTTLERLVSYNIVELFILGKFEKKQEIPSALPFKLELMSKMEPTACLISFGGQNKIVLAPLQFSVSAGKLKWLYEIEPVQGETRFRLNWTTKILEAKLAGIKLDKSKLPAFLQNCEFKDIVVKSIWQVSSGESRRSKESKEQAARKKQPRILYAGVILLALVILFSVLNWPVPYFLYNYRAPFVIGIAVTLLGLIQLKYQTNSRKVLFFAGVGLIVFSLATSILNIHFQILQGGVPLGFLGVLLILFEAMPGVIAAPLVTAGFILLFVSLLDDINNYTTVPFWHYPAAISLLALGFYLDRKERKIRTETNTRDRELRVNVMKWMAIIIVVVTYLVVHFTKPG